MDFPVSKCAATLPWLLCLGLQAGNGAWELGGSLAVGKEEKSNINNNGNFPTMPYTMVVNQLSGSWYQGGVQVGYRIFTAGPWAFWAQGQYSAGLSHPSLFHSGENYDLTSATTESFTGSADYKSILGGVALTRKLTVGEIGLGLGYRSHDLSVSGRRQTRVNGTFTYDEYSVDHRYNDLLLAFSYTLTQDQGGYESFQKIVIGLPLGSSVPEVQPGPNDWKMSEAYLAQIRPGWDVRFTLGVRL